MSKKKKKWMATKGDGEVPYIYGGGGLGGGASADDVGACRMYVTRARWDKAHTEQLPWQGTAEWEFVAAGWLGGSDPKPVRQRPMRMRVGVQSVQPPHAAGVWAAIGAAHMHCRYVSVAVFLETAHERAGGPHGQTHWRPHGWPGEPAQRTPSVVQGVHTMQISWHGWTHRRHRPGGPDPLASSVLFHA